MFWQYGLYQEPLIVIADESFPSRKKLFNAYVLRLAYNDRHNIMLPPLCFIGGRTYVNF